MEICVQILLDPTLPLAGSETTYVIQAHLPLGHTLTLLGWSPPLHEVPSQKQQMSLSCWAGSWAQLPRGTRTEDLRL